MVMDAFGPVGADRLGPWSEGCSVVVIRPNSNKPTVLLEQVNEFCVDGRVQSERLEKCILSETFIWKAAATEVLDDALE